MCIHTNLRNLGLLSLQYKEYLSEDEAKQLLYDRERWMQYKNALWARMTQRLPLTVDSNR